MDTTKPQLTISLASALLSMEGVRSNDTTAAIIKHLFRLYGPDEVLNALNTAAKSAPKSIHQICDNIRSSFSRDEKLDVLLIVLMVASINGSQENLPSIDCIAADMAISNEHLPALKSLFFDAEPADTPSKDMLSLGSPHGQADIPIRNFNGRGLFLKFTRKRIKLIIISGSGLIHNDRSLGRLPYAADFDADDILSAEQNDFSIDHVCLENLFENKISDKSTIYRLVQQGNRLALSRDERLDALAEIHQQANQFRLVRLKPGTVFIVSGEKYPHAVPPKFNILEKLFVEGIREGIFIGGPTTGKKVVSPCGHATFKLTEYDNVFATTAQLICRYDRQGAHVMFQGDDIPASFTVSSDQSKLLKWGESMILGNLYIRAERDGLNIHAVSIRNIALQHLTAWYPGKPYSTVRDVSFTLNCGEILAILGPSGSGKSSIISALLNGMLIEKGQITINGRSAPQGLLSVKQLVGYVPQDDVLDGSLTVYENLSFYRRLKTRSAISRQALTPAIDRILEDFKIAHKKHQRVISPKTRLSGGQRKRLSTAMELLDEPEVLLLDEPTSGLSSSDSELIIGYLKKLTWKGTLVLVVIHQPSASLLAMFDKVLVLNKDGESLFFGRPDDALDLFRQVAEGDQTNGAGGAHPVGPDILLSAQENALGAFWKALRLMPPFTKTDRSSHCPMDEPIEKKPLPVFRPATFKDALIQLPLQVTRQFFSKSRDPLNQWLSFVIPPLLGIIIALVFRSSPGNGPYAFNTNAHYPHFLFMIVITGTFLGLLASVFEILKDRPMLQRESLSEVSLGGYFFAKFFVLFLFGLVQSIAFIIPSHWILGVEYMGWVNAGLMVLVTTIGIGFGLFFSTLTTSVIAAYNLVPLILIPQIILGGGFLPYSQMGEGLYGLERISTSRLDSPDRDKAPLVARILPAAWAYEFLVTANYYFHPVRMIKDEKQAALEAVIAKYKGEQRRKENRKVLLSYEPRLAVYERRLNEEIQSIQSGSARGTYCALKHNFLRDSGIETLFSGMLSQTWFLDLCVLLGYLLVLYTLGYFFIKRTIQRR